MGQRSTTNVNNVSAAVLDNCTERNLSLDTEWRSRQAAETDSAVAQQRSDGVTRLWARDDVAPDNHQRTVPHTRSEY